MATGALDANGIWQYGEDDSEPTFSGMLNKLASSTSTTVTRLEELSGLTAAQLTTHRDNLGVGLVNVVPSSVAQAGGSASANAQGLVTFTGVTSLDINNVFSSAYSSYKVFVNITGGTITTTDVGLNIRMPGATTAYESQYIRSYAVNINAARNPVTTAFWLGPAGFSIYAAYEVTITNPNVAAKTIFTSIGGGDNASTERMTHHVTGYLNNSTQYTGLQLYPTTAAISGTIQIFGLNN